MSAVKFPRLAAQDALENAVHSTAPLVETLASVLQQARSPHGINLSDDAITGLYDLAMQQGKNLSDQFLNFLDVLRDAKEAL